MYKRNTTFISINEKYLAITRIENVENKLIIIVRGKSPITDPLLIPIPSRISVTIRDIKK